MNTTYQISNTLYISKCMIFGWFFHADGGEKLWLINVPTQELLSLLDACPVVSKEAFKKAIFETEKKRGTEDLFERREEVILSIGGMQKEVEALNAKISRAKAEAFELEWKKEVEDLLRTKAFGGVVAPPESFYFVNDIDVSYCEGRLAYVIAGGPKQYESNYVDIGEYVDKIFKVYC